MTRMYKIYVCREDECLYVFDIEATCARSAEVQVRTAFRGLPADVTFYRSC